MPRLAVGLTQPGIQWAPGVLSSRVKWLGCEVDHSRSFSAKVMNGGATLLLPHAIYGRLLNELSTFTLTMHSWLSLSLVKNVHGFISLPVNCI